MEILGLLLVAFVGYSIYCLARCANEAEEENFQKDLKEWEEKYGNVWKARRRNGGLFNKNAPPIPPRPYRKDGIVMRWVDAVLDFLFGPPDNWNRTQPKKHWWHW